MSIKPLLKEKWSFSDIPDLSGKVIIVTGSNRGLGFIAARELAIKRAQVIMAVRNIEEGENAKNTITAENHTANITVMKLDLANLQSIELFAN